MSRRSRLVLATLATAGLFAGIGVADAAESKAPLELVEAKQFQAAKVVTKAGTTLQVRVYDAAPWRWESSKALREPTGQVVLIVFDAGDGVSLDMGDGVSITAIVRLFHAMGAIVIVPETDLVSETPIDPAFLPKHKTNLVSETPIDPAFVPKDSAADRVHALITWSAKSYASDGRINLVALGDAADLSLGVAATRTSSLRSVVTDGASTKALNTFASSFVRAKGFDGLLVLAGDKSGVKALESAGTLGQVDVGGKSLLSGATLEVVGDARLQQTLAGYINRDFVGPD